MIGARTLVTLLLLIGGFALAFFQGVLAPERLMAHGPRSLFLIGCFAAVVGPLMVSFWRLGEKSQHAFGWGKTASMWETEGTLLGSESWGLTMAPNRGRTFELGARGQYLVTIGIALLVALSCIDARTVALLQRFVSSLGVSESSYCREQETLTKIDQANAPGCELMRRAVALGYAADLGPCAPREEIEKNTAICQLRQRDEPWAHYGWRLLQRSVEGFLAPRPASASTARLDRLETVAVAQKQILVTAPRASHHIWTNLPAPGKKRLQSCTERYRSLAHRPAASLGATGIFEHILGQLLFETRYEPSAGDCRELTIHWGAPADICTRLAANPAQVLVADGVLSDVRAVLEREGARKELHPTAPLPQGYLSFACWIEGGGPSQRSFSFVLDGRGFTAHEIHVPPADPAAELHSDRYNWVAKLLAGNFHYGALLSEAGAQHAASGGLEAFFEPSDYLFSRTFGMESHDIYLEPGWIVRRRDLLEIYPYELHLKNYVQIFRRQYRLLRGRL